MREHHPLQSAFNKAVVIYVQESVRVVGRMVITRLTKVELVIRHTYKWAGSDNAKETVH